MSDPHDALDQIKERMKVGGYRTVALGGDPEAKVWPSETWKVCDSQADIPSLVAAIEAVLEKAGYMTRYAHGQDYWGGVRAASQEILAALNDKLTGEDDE